jgi:hypothetical protein
MWQTLSNVFMEENIGYPYTGQNEYEGGVLSAKARLAVN